MVLSPAVLTRAARPWSRGARRQRKAGDGCYDGWRGVRRARSWWLGDARARVRSDPGPSLLAGPKSRWLPNPLLIRPLVTSGDGRSLLSGTPRETNITPSGLQQWQAAYRLALAHGGASVCSSQRTVVSARASASRTSVSVSGTVPSAARGSRKPSFSRRWRCCLRYSSVISP